MMRVFIGACLVAAGFAAAMAGIVYATGLIAAAALFALLD